MKNAILSLAFAGAFILFALTTLAQTPPDPQCIIATATTPYTQPGSTYANNPNNFDWKASEWLLWILRDDGTFYSVSAESPFWDPGPVFFPNTNHLAVNSTGDPRDFEPGDGWELLMDDRGTSSKPVRVPTVTLYNRFEAKVRQFQWMTIEPGLFQTASQTVVRDKTYNRTSALFEHANSPMNALDRFDKSIEVEAFNEYTVQGGTWLFSEFAAAYDPCTCVFQSGINFEPRLFREESISLKLEGTSISDPVIAGTKAKTTAINKFSSAIGKVVSTAEVVPKGYKSYDNLNKLTKDLGDYVDNLGINPNTKAPYKLPSFIKDLPQIGAIATVLEFLIGGGKSSASAKPSSYQSRYKFEGTGTVNFVQTFEQRSIYTPGSVKKSIPPPAGTDVNRIPIYNNPLGIMNVLETPIIEIVKKPFSSSEPNYKYKLKENIKYAINGTAGLGNLVQLKGSLYFDYCEGVDDPNITTLTNLLPVDNHTMRTPFVPLGVLPEYTINAVNFTIPPLTAWLGCDPEINPTLEVIATFQPQGSAEEVFYASRFKADPQLAPVVVTNLPPNPYAGIPENITVENLNLTSDASFTAWNSITVITDNIVFNGYFIHLYTAGTLIFKGNNIPVWIQARLNADGEYDFFAPIGFSGGPNPRGDYIPHFWMPGTPNPPQTPTQIAGFCTNPAKYNPLQSVAPPDEDVYSRQVGEQLLRNNFKLVPSISSDYTAVHFDLNQSINVNISVVNAMGQVEMEDLREQLEAGTYIKSMDVSRLPQGMHFVVIQLDGKHYTTLRFVKQ